MPYHNKNISIYKVRFQALQKICMGSIGDRNISVIDSKSVSRLRGVDRLSVE